MAKNRWISDLHWVREGQQDRSQRTQEALLDAAEELFAEQGAQATSVADVARRAGCSVGAVYHHFRDKKSLVYAVFQRWWDIHTDIMRRAVEPGRWKGASVSDILQGYLEFLLRAARERPAFKRAGHEAARTDPALQARLEDLHERLNRGLRKLLLARRAEIAHPDPKLAVDFVLDQLASMIKTRLDDSLVPTELASLSDRRFVGQALRSASAYLQLRAAGSN